MSLKSFSIFSSLAHYVQSSTTILAYLVEGKLFENWSIGLGVDIISMFFSILALAVILFIRVEQFDLFW